MYIDYQQYPYSNFVALVSDCIKLNISLFQMNHLWEKLCWQKPPSGLFMLMITPESTNMHKLLPKDICINLRYQISGERPFDELIISLDIPKFDDGLELGYYGRTNSYSLHITQLLINNMNKYWLHIRLTYMELNKVFSCSFCQN